MEALLTSLIFLALLTLHFIIYQRHPMVSLVYCLSTAGLSLFLGKAFIVFAVLLCAVNLLQTLIRHHRLWLLSRKPVVYRRRYD